MIFLQVSNPACDVEISGVVVGWCWWFRLVGSVGGRWVRRTGGGGVRWGRWYLFVGLRVGWLILLIWVWVGLGVGGCLVWLVLIAVDWVLSVSCGA